MMWDGAAVKAFRKSRGENQETFAKAVGVARSAVSEWENGGTVSDLSAAALDRLKAGIPREVAPSYWDGVLWAAEQMNSTVGVLLRTAREARSTGQPLVPALETVNQTVRQDVHGASSDAKPHRRSAGE